MMEQRFPYPDPPERLASLALPATLPVGETRWLEAGREGALRLPSRRPLRA